MPTSDEILTKLLKNVKFISKLNKIADELYQKGHDREAAVIHYRIGLYALEVSAKAKDIMNTHQEYSILLEQNSLPTDSTQTSLVNPKLIVKNVS